MRHGQWVGRRTLGQGVATIHRSHRDLTRCMDPPFVARGIFGMDVWSCVNVIGPEVERFLLRAIIDIGAHSLSLADSPRWAIRVVRFRMRRRIIASSLYQSRGSRWVRLTFRGTFSLSKLGLRIVRRRLGHALPKLGRAPISAKALACNQMAHVDI